MRFSGAPKPDNTRPSRHQPSFPPPALMHRNPQRIVSLSCWRGAQERALTHLASLLGRRESVSLCGHTATNTYGTGTSQRWWVYWSDVGISYSNSIYRLWLMWYNDGAAPGLAPTWGLLAPAGGCRPRRGGAEINFCFPLHSEIIIIIIIRRKCDVFKLDRFQCIYNMHTAVCHCFSVSINLALWV